MKQKAKMLDWRIELYNPFIQIYVLTGVIKDHPRQKEFLKDRQMSSELLSVDFKNKTAETLNTIYTLED